MSVEPATSDVEGYCDPRDVTYYFDRFNQFEPTDQTSDEQIRQQIAAKSEYIDSQTGHAWRERRMVDEFHDLSNLYRYGSGTPVSLMRRDIRTPFDAEKGDKIELYRGASGSSSSGQTDEYTDLVAEETFSEGRGGDFWVESSTGMLHVYRRQSLFSNYRELRVTYRFGKEKVPAAIEEATAKLVAADLMESDFYRYTQPGNEEAPDAQRIAEGWREQVDMMLEPYTEIKTSGIGTF